MARISGVNIPTGKKIHIALTYIFGIGSKIAHDLCDQASIDKTKRVNELNDDELVDLSSLLELDDENLYKLNRGLSTTVTIKHNKVSTLFSDFKYE